MLTHGEQMLMAAEMRARRMVLRRRMITVGAPVMLAIFASTAGLIGAQHTRASSGGPPHLLAHAAAIAFTVALVASPALGAVRARRALPAIVAILCGPVLTPILFGPGGWRWWQTIVLAAGCVLVSSAAMQQKAARASTPAAI